MIATSLPHAGQPARTTAELAFAIALASMAVAAPALLAFNLSPSATFLNQAVALIGWGAWLLMLSVGLRQPIAWPHAGGLMALLVALGLLLASVTASSVWAALPSPFALSYGGAIAAAALTVLCAAALVRSGDAEPVFRAFCIALTIAGVCSAAISVIQVFVPDWADGSWIAPSSAEGRATGNLRQPNHLSSLLLWSIIAALWLAETARVRRGWAVLAALAMMFALVLSASRTGFVCVVLLAAWGALDRGLSRSARVGLLLAPLAYLLFWGGLALWAHETHHIFGGEARVNESNDSPNSRLNIWSNAIALIRQHPWSGVGFGEFNFAWSLTPFPHRPTAFFDHTHNIVLQFAVELGLPLAALVLLLMAYALWRAFVAGRRAPDAQGLLLRSAFMMVLLMVVHSMLEYPLWYAYFLLPTAFAFGLCLGTPGESASGLLPVPAAAGPVRRVATVGALLLMLAGVASVFDYLRVSAVFAESGPPLAQRIANGQRSWLFAQHADYAAATTADHPSEAMASFKVATHYLLDTRLMIAWANALNESGDVERARYIAQRLREFRNDDAKPFFAPCDEPGQSAEPLPFQCTPPSRSFDYRDFR